MQQLYMDNDIFRTLQYLIIFEGSITMEIGVLNKRLGYFFVEQLLECVH